jgi:hypothetical protein
MTVDPALPEAQGAYRSYLVRLWQSGPRGQWRASVLSIQGGHTQHFADLAALFAFLQAETAMGPDADPAGHAADKSPPPGVLS